MAGGDVTDLVLIAPGHYLANPAASSWERAVAAGCPVTITSSYRSPERQAQMRVAYLAAKARGEKVAYVAPVAESEHVTGNALDLKDPAIAWMRAHPDYGFVFTDPTERWHVAYRFARDQHLTDISPIDPIPEDDMTPDQERLLSEVHAMLGAGGAVGQRVEDTIGYRVRDIQTALTNALPVLLADATADDVVAAIPDGLVQAVLDGLAKRLAQ